MNIRVIHMYMYVWLFVAFFKLEIRYKYCLYILFFFNFIYILYCHLLFAFQFEYVFYLHLFFYIRHAVILLHQSNPTQDPFVFFKCTDDVHLYP